MQEGDIEVEKLSVCGRLRKKGKDGSLCARSGKTSVLFLTVVVVYRLAS